MAKDKKDKAVRIDVEDGTPSGAPSGATEGTTDAKPAGDAPQGGKTEEELVAEAIARGEKAAEDELAQDASKLRKERDELQRKLASADEDIRAAKAKAQEATERQARLQADWDNYRKRTAAERLAERERATEHLVGDLLPVIDDLERAIDHAGDAGENPQLAQFVEGVSAVHAKLLSVLAKEGAEPIDPVGQPFDPLAHQAVGRVEDKDAYAETVAQVYQKGYRMGGKVIRSAMVTVTYGGPKRPADAGDAPGAGADGSK